MKKQISVDLQGRGSLDEPKTKRAKTAPIENIVHTSHENLFSELSLGTGSFAIKQDLSDNKVRFCIKLPHSFFRQLSTLNLMFDGREDEISLNSDLLIEVITDPNSKLSQHYTQLLDFLTHFSYEDLSEKDRFKEKVENLLKESLENRHDFIKNFKNVSHYFGLDFSFKVIAFVGFPKESEDMPLRIKHFNSTLIDDTQLDSTRKSILIELFKVDVHIDQDFFQQNETERARLIQVLNEISQKQFYFNFKNSPLSEVQKLIDFLKKVDKTFVRELNMAGVQLIPVNLVALAEAIQAMPHLESLNLSGITITPELIEAIPTSLKALNVAGVGLETEGVGNLTRKIQQMSDLESLNLSGITIESPLIEAIPTSLKALNVANSRLNNWNVGNLTRKIQQMSDLESLNLAKIHLGNPNGQSLIQGLIQNQKLRYLNLQETNLSIAATQILTIVLPRLPLLQSLTLLGCFRITEYVYRYAQLLIPSLSSLSKLKHLNISGLTPCAPQIQNLYPRTPVLMPNLESLDISNNDGFFKNETIDQLAQFLSVKKLNMNFNDLSSEQIDTFLRVLPSFTQLQELDMACNILTETQSRTLLKTLIQLPHFKRLNIEIQRNVLTEMQTEIETKGMEIEKNFDIHFPQQMSLQELPLLSSSEEG